MVVIKVQWDGYNRNFRLLDKDLVHHLEDGETYALIADVKPSDVIVEEKTPSVVPQSVLETFEIQGS